MLLYYPSIKPYQEHHIAVSPHHTVYVEECGNPNGLPVLFVHGGPGGGCSEDNRRFFDPNVYRIILFDQRGCGRSTPHAELEENHTQALVADMEMIREQLGIEQWMLFGGSWGSTLSLVYAIHHPERVSSMILRGIFLNRKRDRDWLFSGKGANTIFPDYWQDFLSVIPTEKQHDLINAYYALLTGEDEVARMAAAKAWSIWEGRCATLEPNPDVIEAMQSPHLALSLARLECHYFVNECFMPDNFILKNVHKIHNIPGIIVHGRYDIVCNLDNAWTLHQAWPRSTLKIVRDAGHASSEPGIIDALIQSTREFSNGSSEPIKG